MKMEGRFRIRLISSILYLYTTSFELPTLQTPGLHVEMEEEIYITESDKNYPVLLIPKECTSFEPNHDNTDNVIVAVNITSPDTEGNQNGIYSGFCNVKFIDSDDFDISATDINGQTDSNESAISIAVNDASQSQVWIDPARSPFVYTSHGAVDFHFQTLSNCPIVEQHNTYITHNVYNYKESIHDSPVQEFENRKFRKIVATDTSQVPYTNLYENDEFESGVFSNQLPEEIEENENKGTEELKDIELQEENDALKQLMSPDIQSMSKQQKTILYSGRDSHCGQTIHKIRVDDPSLECVGNGVGSKAVKETKSKNEKKYQCEKCKQLFDQLSEFKQHMVGNHKSKKSTTENDSTPEVKYECDECGKILKNKQKFEIHCLGHGNPDVECEKCHKVFASKFTLKIHRNSVHQNKCQCVYCTKSFYCVREIKNHVEKSHIIFICEICDYSVSKYSEFKAHIMSTHKQIELKHAGEGSSTLSLDDDDIPLKDFIIKSDEDQTRVDKITAASEADSVIAKVMATEIFMPQSRKALRHKKYKKICNVCLKSFDRIGDLKRHLIEHVVKSTLAKTPVNINGTLTIQCEICKSEVFSRVDRYKTHLREHARLTLYKCTFCDKSFSDSSNFSKHKKIHGSTFFQCDLCQRKFNSKKTISRHMEYHNNNSPLSCRYCGKQFHFRSMLNKHIKCAHNGKIPKFRCIFCQNYFTTLKDKWDHEWRVHRVRKIIVDCLICGSKFRKYSELKKHCYLAHGMKIPRAECLRKTRLQVRN